MNIERYQINQLKIILTHVSNFFFSIITFKHFIFYKIQTMIQQLFVDTPRTTIHHDLKPFIAKGHRFFPLPRLQTKCLYTYIFALISMIQFFVCILFPFTATLIAK